MATRMIMATAITTTMTTEDFARLLAWTSPAYPVGAYTYSHGIEAAVEDGAVCDAATLAAYIRTVLHDGAGHIDGALCAAAIAAVDDAALDAIAELAFAWRGTAETALESTAQGNAFALVTMAAWPDAGFAAFCARHPKRLAHASAFGAACRFAAIPPRDAVFAYLTAFAANLTSAGVRLVPLGQTDGQRVTAGLLPAITAATEAALAADLDDLGTASPMIDLFSMRHETQYTRLFRS
ncbi:urease accessory protein UreF [Plastoroseomonas arctica]|nr:urease accessory UreF family protein [Plastoroseomonas arctica]